MSWRLGDDVVVTLLEVLPKDVLHDVYFDNYIMSLPLMEQLVTNNIRATGTLNKIKLLKMPIISPGGPGRQTQRV